MFELGNPKALDERQTELIKRHLDLVFVHEIDSPDPTGVLQAAHDGKKLPQHMLSGRPKNVRC